MLPFDGLGYPSREFLTIAGNPVAVTVLGDLTVNEEIAGVELQSRWESADFTDPGQAVEYRLEAVALFLSSRTGRAWTVEEVKQTFTSKTTKRLFALWQAEIEASLADQPDSGEEAGGKLQNTGRPSTGDCNTTTPANPDSAPTALEIAPSG